MRLSDIQGERVIDVIAEIIEPITRIATAPEVKELMERKKLPEGMDPRAFAVQRLTAAIPKLLKSHKRDIIEILSIVKGCSYEEYLKQLNMASLLKDCMELGRDEMLSELFLSAQSMETSSQSAPMTSVGEQCETFSGMPKPE